MKKNGGLVLLFLALLFSCNQKSKKAEAVLRKIDMTVIDSVIKNSDTTYTKPYKRTDFVTAVYYLNRPNKMVCQLMKDSAGTIRQVIIAKNDVRTFYAQYYANGQLMATLPLDAYGQYHGKSVSYYSNGAKQNEGEYSHGMYTGKWNNYDEEGQLTSVYEYDTNGSRIK